MNVHDSQIQVESAEWVNLGPEPLDLFGTTSVGRTPVLTRDMLPKVIADFAFDQGELMGVEPAMVAIPALTAAAAAITDALEIQHLRYNDTWTESARLWTVAVAAPGVGKTPAMRAALKPLEELQRKWGKEHAKARAKHEQDKKKGQDSTEPVERRAITNEFTIESLVPILRDNPQGILAYCDELSGMIGSFDAYKAQGTKKDRAAMLELANGGPRRVDRKTTGSADVQNWGVSLMGGIQPEKLASIAGGLVDDGFLQRGLLYRGRRVGKNQDRKPDAEAKAAYESLFSGLAQVADITAITVTLEPDAHPHRERVDALIEAFIQQPTTPAALKEHLSKWPGMYARLLLTLHVIECVSRGEPVAPAVSERTAKQAADLMLKFFLPNALALYREFFNRADGRLTHAQWVGNYILAHGCEEITVRDIRRAYKVLANDEHGIKRTMADLEEALWVGPANYSHQGSARWAVNQMVHMRFAERAAAESERREKIRKDIEESQRTINRELQ